MDVERDIAVGTVHTLKFFGRLAEDDCHSGPSSEQMLRWEIYSAWRLLMFLRHVDMEADIPAHHNVSDKWCEGQALQQSITVSKSLRSLTGVLRWMRWSTTPTQNPPPRDQCDFERSFRQAKTQSRIPQPMRGNESFVMHPDGPLQKPESFHRSDLESERELLRALWGLLRRGDLQEAMNLCAERGQPWRAAMLQGMLAHNPAKEQFVKWAYQDVDEEWIYEMDRLKEMHSDWSEMFYVNAGNPWRRVWKETCMDIAESPPHSIGDYEAAITGFCAGYLPAMLPLCANGVEKAWAEIHCLKEALVERCLHEMKRRWLDDDEEMEPESNRLFGVFSGVRFEDLDAVTYKEIQRIFQDIEQATDAESCFRNVHFLIVQAAWEPSYLGKTMDYLRKWMDSCDEVPFLVKQFASYFASFQKEGLPHAELVRHEQNQINAGKQPETVIFFTDESVDYLVKEHVTELIKDSAAGVSMEVIVEHLSVLTRDKLIEVYAWFLLYLGPKGKNNDPENITRCLGVLWERFPLECLTVTYTFCRQVIQSAWAGYSANNFSARSDELFHALFVLTRLWMIISTMDDLNELSTLSVLIQGLGMEPAEEKPEQAQQVLEEVFIPLLVDIICTALVVSESTLELASLLDSWEDEILWKNLLSEHADHLEGINRLRVDIPWYMTIFTTHAAWQSTFTSGSGPYQVKTLLSESELREDFIEKALPFIEFEKFLEPIKGSHLNAAQWEKIHSVLSYRVLGAFESIYTMSGDLQGALEQLTVAVAQSPWMLLYIGPEKAKAFLHSLVALATKPRHIK